VGRLGVIAEATLGNRGWVDLAKPIMVPGGEAFVTVLE